MTNHPNRQSPFGLFWKALSLELTRLGYAELTYGPARALWVSTIGKATELSHETEGR